jgi:hypothetical protein
MNVWNRQICSLMEMSLITQIAIRYIIGYGTMMELIITKTSNNLKMEAKDYFATLATSENLFGNVDKPKRIHIPNNKDVFNELKNFIIQDASRFNGLSDAEFIRLTTESGVDNYFHFTQFSIIDEYEIQAKLYNVLFIITTD